jgi:iron complex outermembrane recepter protein
MSVKTKRALWLGSAVSFAFAGFATIALADEKAGTPLESVQVTQGVQVAQATTPTPPPPPPTTAEEEEAKKVERVVVTGSRLKKSEFTSSAPIQIITREETTLEGLNDTAEILQGSTLASGAQQINNTFGGFVTDGGPGANTLGLRGLDPRRTLILINGRRLAPAGSRGSIGAPDLNTIPESIIERYEILKDGGSAIYGSDAVAGVVNAITRTNYDGASIEAYGNMSFEGGAEEGQLNALWGETFDRGYVMVAGEYFRREALVQGDRDYLKCPQDLVRRASNGAVLDIIDPLTGESKCFNTLEGVVDLLAGPGGRYIPNPGLLAGGGFLATQTRTPLIPPGPAVVIGGSLPNQPNLQRVGHSFAQVNTYINNICAVANGALADGSSAAVLAANPYCATPAGIAAQKESVWRSTTNAVLTNDPRQAEATIISPVTRYSFFGQGTYDVMAGLEAYTELQFTRRESEQNRFRQIFPNVSGTNPNNPHGLTARSIVLIATDSDQTVDYYRGVVGARGDFSDRLPIFGNWSYDLYVQHQRSEADYTDDVIYNDRVIATTQGGSACVQALITISGGSCASIPGGIRWFDPTVVATGQFNAAERAFLFTKETGHTTFDQTLVNGSVTGDVFELPAGPLSAALGFEYRIDEIDDTPSATDRAQNSWGRTTAGRTAGSDTVREVFAELSAPILAGWDLAESLTIDASTRYTSYDSYGEDYTYKLGLNWQITPEYRLRGTTGTSFRAPALFELFLANQTGFQNQTAIDPCGFWDTSSNPQIVASCGPLGLNLPPGYNPAVYASALVVSGGGGPGVLSAETSESRTVGFIWTPDWIDFSVAFDYWELEVNNEVAQFGPANIIGACHTQPPFPTSPFCTLFQRDTNPLSPTFGMILTVEDSFVNIGAENTDGLDVTVRYEHEFSFGTFRLNADLGWVFTREIRFFPDDGSGQPAEDFNGEQIFPDFIGALDLRFDHDDWTFFWAVDMVGRSSDDEEFGGSVFAWRGFELNAPVAYYKQFSEFTATHDASVRLRMDDWTFQVGVQNIFDEVPPTISTAGIANSARLGNTSALGAPAYDLVGRSGFINITKEF